jgi:hypothetical protein
MNTSSDIHGPELLMPDFAVARLPVCGLLAGRADAGARLTGVALSYAEDEADLCGEDRFHLLLIDAEGRTAQVLGPFPEEDVVAIWRDLAAQAGLTRMIVREDGGLVPVALQVGRLMLGRVRIRRRHAGLGARRPRFLARRKTGRLPARPQIFRGEEEIIARS